MVRVLSVSFLCVFFAPSALAQPASSLSGEAQPQDEPEDREFVPAADGQLGSTMTLKAMDERAAAPGTRAAELALQEHTWLVDPAPEPQPALRTKLWIPRHERRPGPAMLHYVRASISYYSLSRTFRDELQEYWGSSRDGVEPNPEDVARFANGLQGVYSHIHDLALSEDITWDHRIRDLRGPQVFAYLLPDVQDVRILARLLEIKGRHQIHTGDFDGLQSTLADGFRLAEFTAQGETLIQKLVALAIAAMMREVAHDAIQAPGCPNMYWAAAAIPRPLVSMRDGLDWELSNMERVFPVLAEAESAEWTETEAEKAWSGIVGDLATLAGPGDDSRDARIALALAAVTMTVPARTRLSAQGFPEERLQKLPALQIVMIDAARDLRRITDDLNKGTLLPDLIGRDIVEREYDAMEEWTRANRLTSGGALIAATLLPSIRQAREAERRSEAYLSRVMTIEAIRMHVAKHGQLPTDLDSLDPVPAMPDPYTGQHFGYSVQTVDGNEQITLTMAAPEYMKQHGSEIRISFRKP